MTPKTPRRRLGEPGPDLFLRRVPDQRRRWRRPRACYEVGAFSNGNPDPITVERTVYPTSVLVRGGVHTSDVRDYVCNADASWQGGVGPWRGVYPDVGPS